MIYSSHAPPHLSLIITSSKRQISPAVVAADFLNVIGRPLKLPFRSPTVIY